MCKKKGVVNINNLTTKQKIVFIGIIAFMVIVIIIYFITNFDNLYGEEEIIENSEFINIEEINGMDTELGNEIEEKSEMNENEEEEIIVHVAGAVNNPGIVKLKENKRIADAINLAGGPTKDADVNQVNLAYVLEDGQRVYIPTKDEKLEESQYVIDGSGNTNENVGKEDKKVDINNASQTEIETLPGIGPSLASKIIEYREQNGGFKNVEELQNVKGIGDAKYGEIKDRVLVK